MVGKVFNPLIPNFSVTLRITRTLDRRPVAKVHDLDYFPLNCLVSFFVSHFPVFVPVLFSKEPLIWRLLYLFMKFYNERKRPSF